MHIAAEIVPPMGTEEGAHGRLFTLHLVVG